MQGRAATWAAAVAGTAALCAASGWCLRAAAESGAPGKAPEPRVAPARGAGYGALPLLFVENRGQTDPRVGFHAWGRGRAIFLRDDGVTFRLRDRRAGKAASVAMDFVDARADARPRGLEAAATTVSWFKGPRSSWKTGVGTWTSVGYPELWPGVDLVYTGAPGSMKYEMHVAAGADPSRIRFAWRGATSMAIDAAGRLEVATSAGSFRDERPVSWQEIDGRRVDVPTSYVLGPADEDGTRTLGFRLGAYDPSLPLVVDPAVIVYCGYLGERVDEGDSAIAVDGSGNAYVAARTDEDEDVLPEVVGPDLTQNGDIDAIVAKVNAAGTGLVYYGFIGGDNFDEVVSIALDSSGNAHVAGRTRSSEATFPVVGTLGATYSAGDDAFVAKVNAAGTALVYCGYIGGTGDERALGIAVGGTGTVHVAGWTNSPEASFPVTGGPDLSYNGGTADAFVATVTAAGTLQSCGYMGGDADDAANDIAVNSLDDVYVTGTTLSTEATFPVTGGPDLVQNGNRDIWVARLDSSTVSVGYCGFIGGAGNEVGPDVACDSAGSAYVSGSTHSSETTFPVAGGPDLVFNMGSRDAFVAKVVPNGTSLAWCGYIGGAGWDVGMSIAVDGSGRAWVSGSTYLDSAPTFPVADGPDLTHDASDDGFIVRVAADGSAVEIGSYVGGGSSDYCTGIAVDAAGDPYVTGYTFSDHTTFPVATGPDLVFEDTGSQTFVAKVSTSGVVPPSAIESYFLPKKVKVKLNALDAAKSTFVAVGFLDTGPDADADLAASAELDLGGEAVDVPALVADATGTRFSYSAAGVLFQVTASKAGSSKAKFKVKFQGDLTGDVDPEGDLGLQFDNGTITGLGTVGLDAGGFVLGRRRGALVAPNLYLYKAKAVLAGDGADTLSLKVGLATGGATPETAPAVVVGFGDGFSETIPSEAFVPNGDRFEFRGDVGGITLVVLDYLKETVTVKGKGLELGEFPGGPAPVRVTVGLDGDVRAVRVLFGRRGAALVY
jgi:hypothetical protein